MVDDDVQRPTPTEGSGAQAMTRGDVERADDDMPEAGAMFESSELVGVGRYPLRVQPAAALVPGSSDARRLMAVWFVRKSFYWLFFLGWGVGSLVAYWSRGQSEPNIDIPDLAREGILSPWIALLLALITRFVNNWVALGLAYPLAIAHEPGLSERTNVGSGIGKFFDRLHVARGFRSFRWTHHVRQIALRRLGTTGRRLAKLDPILDIINIVSAVVGTALVMYVALQTS